MSLIKTVTPKLAFDGGKAFWSVDQSLIMDIDGSEYVKLTKMGINGGFTRLVIENCPTLPAELDKKFSLTWSRGYLELAQLRNAEQQKQHAAEKNDTAAAVFAKKFGAASERPSYKTHVKVPKAQIKSLNESPEALTITIPSFDTFEEMQCRVKKPIANPREDLVVEFNEVVIERIIRFIRFQGFDQNLARAEERSTGVYAPGPYGNLRLKGRITMRAATSDGRKKRLVIENVERAEAIAKGELPVKVEDENSEEGELLEDGELPEDDANEGQLPEDDAKEGELHVGENVDAAASSNDEGSHVSEVETHAASPQSAENVDDESKEDKPLLRLLRSKKSKEDKPTQADGYEAGNPAE